MRSPDTQINLMILAVASDYGGAFNAAVGADKSHPFSCSEVVRKSNNYSMWRSARVTRGALLTVYLYTCFSYLLSGDVGQSDPVNTRGRANS